MKRSLSFVLFLFLFNQIQLIAEKSSGYLVDTYGDSTFVDVHIPTFFPGVLHPLEFQKHPKIWVNNTLVDLDLSKYCEVGFTYQDKKYIFRKLASLVNDTPVVQMKQLIRDGNIQIYRNYFSPAFEGNSYTSQLFLVNRKSIGMYPRTISFRKKIVKYLKSCPDINRLVRSKKLKRKDLEEVVAEYDNFCDR